ncbi:hypothetical protein [uncultured Chryseobacterium sp.]|uniref:hypothetical protein n=1 Tax=uncultured Chryseobacterium sp. TaxID=259322 RepID=UPI0025EE132E|nr:hypothetical protein [uncultured Chryseobacterium sp.]
MSIKVYTSLLLIVFGFLLSYGQKIYSTNEILKTFPLKKSTKVKIISYNIDFIGEYALIPPPPNRQLDSVQLKEYYESLKKPVKLKEVISHGDLNAIQQSKTLTVAETFELTKLLFNTCGKFTGGNYRISKCFFPRNAILFYNENDEVFDFLEICFECDRIEALSDKATEINYMCDTFFRKLESFFRNKGLQTQYIRN